MKLRSLELTHFRKFDRAVRIGPLADGINVLCGPNEFGKSTLLAAIRGVLFERHSSRAEAVRGMRHHRGETSPRIAMNFETETGLHRIEKRFLHREPFARLTLPDGTRVDGDAAEEALQALLGFRAAGKQGARPEDAGMWGALWVTQRELVDQPALANPARATLHACLEAEIGAVSGGERGQGILREVREDLAQLRDGRGQPKGRLKETGELLARTETELLRLTDKRRALSDDIEALQGRRRDLAHATQADPVAKLIADLDATKLRRDTVLRYADRYNQAATALRLAELAHAGLAREKARRAGREQQFAAVVAQVAGNIAEEREALTALAQSEAALGRLDAVHARAEQEFEAAAAGLRCARRVADLANRATAAAGVAERLRRAEAAQARVNDCAGELIAIRADDASVQAVHTASRECTRARAVLDAQATAIVLDLEPGADGRVLIDGTPVATTELRAVADVTIDLPGVGRITIRPAIKDRDTLLAGIAKSERRLAEALDAAGASDATDAERRLAQRTALERRLAEARRALDLYAPADPAISLAAGAEALRNHVAVLQRCIAAEVAELDLTEPPPAGAGNASLKEASEAEARAAEALVVARSVLPASRLSRDRRAEAAAHATAARVGAEAEVGRLRHEMEEATVEEEDDALAARLEEAAREVLSRQNVLALVEHARPEDTLPAIDARILRYEQAIDATREDHRRLQQDIAVLQSRILQEEGGGIDEQIAIAERRREDFGRERDALQREADILELLRDTLLEAERATRERYLAPVLERLTPYLRGLFPGSRVHCDENFRITGVTRDGELQEEFARLSDGTQEQIAILSRLAFADMLIDRGRPAMVILDDALAFADRDRMERMFDMLMHAASRMQLLVLTCRGDVFTRLGGNRVELRTMADADGVA